MPYIFNDDEKSITKETTNEKISPSCYNDLLVLYMMSLLGIIILEFIPH